jgi:hypothetical protein
MFFFVFMCLDQMGNTDLLDLYQDSQLYTTDETMLSRINDQVNNLTGG